MAFNTAGCSAVGISGADGSTITGSALHGATCTGTVTAAHPRLLETLIRGGFLPVLSPVSSDQEGNALNINADEVALAVAAAMEAQYLIFLSDTPGVRRGEDIITELDHYTARQEIDSGTITGGMIPKVKASLEAISRGVGSIIIGEFSRPGDLRRLLAGTIGTRLVAAAVR